MDVGVFVSYSSADKDLAGRLKRRLSEFGITAFLAHDDIPGGAEWKDVIRKEIRGCHLLVALVTDTYHEHEYTDQELGMAIFAEKAVVCIGVDGGTPRGFALSYQHIPYNTNEADMERLGAEVLDAVLANMDGEKRVDFAVGCLLYSRHFRDSDVLAKYIGADVRLSESQAILLAKAFVENNQVHGATRFEGKQILPILKRHLHHLDSETAAKVGKVADEIARY